MKAESSCRPPRRSAALLLALLAWPSGALAQPAKVEDLIRQGNEHRMKGNDQWALPLFQKAYDIERSPRTAAQLGLVEASLGYWLSSERHLEEALVSTRNPWLIRFEAQIRKTLAHVKASIGEVEVTGNPPGAEVLVNGQPSGQLPLPSPVRVGEGSVQVTLRAPGFKEASSTTKVEGGKRTTVNIALERLQPGQVASPAATAPAPVARAEGPQIASVPPAGSDSGLATSDGGSPSWLRPASWVATSAAVVALSIGGYGLHVQRARGKEFDSYPAGSPDKTCSENAPNRGGPACKSLYNKMQAGRQMMLGGFIAGGALAVAAIAGFVASSGASDGTEMARATFAPAVAVSGSETTLGLGWSARF